MVTSIERMTSAAEKYVLVMDDSALALELARDALESAGFSVLAASDGDELAEHLSKGPPIDLIVLDVQMPGVSGDAIATGLRSERGLQVPILLCSGHADATLAERARATGAAGYISKQAGIDALVAEVRRILTSQIAS